MLTTENAQIVNIALELLVWSVEMMEELTLILVGLIAMEHMSNKKESALAEDATAIVLISFSLCAGPIGSVIEIVAKPIVQELE